MQLKSNRLGEMLLEAGLIDQFQLDSALSMQRNLGGRIGSAIVKLGYLPEATIIEFLQSQAKYSRLELADLDIPPEVLALFPAERLRYLLVIPVDWCTSGREKSLRVAMTDPTNLKLVEELQFYCGCRVLPALASEEEIRQALNRFLPDLPVAAGLSDAMLEYSLEDLEGMATAEPVDLTSGDMVEFTPEELGASPQAGPVEKLSSGQRLERLLDILQEKGVLNSIDMKRINNR